MSLSHLFILLLLFSYSISTASAKKPEELERLPASERLTSPLYHKAPAMDKLKALNRWRSKTQDPNTQMLYTKEMCQIIGGRDGIDTQRQATKQEADRILAFIQKSGEIASTHNTSFSELYWNYEAPLEHQQIVYLAHKNYNQPDKLNNTSLKRHIVKILRKQKPFKHENELIRWDTLASFFDNNTLYYIEITNRLHNLFKTTIVLGRILKKQEIRKAGYYPYTVVEITDEQSGKDYAWERLKEGIGIRLNTFYN